MAEDSDEETPVIELGTGGRGLSMEAGRAHQEDKSDDEPILGFRLSPVKPRRVFAEFQLTNQNISRCHEL